MKKYLTMAVFLLILGGFFIRNITATPLGVLQSERRAPAAWPELNVQTVVSGEFMNGFEPWAADNFAGRDKLREVRSKFIFDVFRQSDKSGLYLGESGAGKFEKINEQSARKVAEKIGKVAGGLEGLNIYYAIVPDKSLYAGRYLPGFDIDMARNILGEQLEDVEYIDLTGALESHNFYRTDIHWAQPGLSGVLDALGDAMDFEVDKNFDMHNAGDFHGVYTGQIALPLKPDEMIYMTSPTIGSAVVSYLNDRTGKMYEGQMYNIEEITGRDPYALFLCGTQPLITIENLYCEEQRELYIFRDSFTSSLAPLLTSAYSKITLIDLRYIDSRVLPQVVKFTPGSDVLFLYGMQILNNESILLVN